MVLEPAVERRLVGPDRAYDTAIRRPCQAHSARGAVGPARAGALTNDCQAESNQLRWVVIWQADDPNVVRLLLLCHADLAEAEQLSAVRLRRILDVGLDVGEAQDGRQRRTRDAPVAALSLPVVQAIVLQAGH